MTIDTNAAVVGASCRLPGRIHTPDQFWDSLLQGRDLVTGYTQDHPRADILPGAIFDPNSLRFDAYHWGMSASEAATMDPQQQLLLELVDEAFQDAGMSLSAWRGHRVGLWVGSSCLDHALLRLGPGQGGTMVDTAGALPSMLANRVSRHDLIDWRGPSETLDTACSASLVALHRARQALALGEVDLAVVAGTNLLALDTHTRMFRNSGALSSDGRVRAFDQDASGFVRAEGGAVLVLQRQSETVTANVTPRAVLLASSTNCDGAGKPIGAPNWRGQVDLLEHTWSQPGADPSRVGYIEAHGTGTKAGDREEIRALAQVLGVQQLSPQDALMVGSVKTNLGHLEGAAGIVSALKVVLSLQHQQVAPTLHHTRPQPLLAKNGLSVPTTSVPWPRERPLAGVSAFGFGGTNAHAIFAPAQPAPSPSSGDGQHSVEHTHLVPVSASTETAVRQTASAWAGVAQDHTPASVAYTAWAGRDHHRGSRAAVLATGPSELASGLQALGSGSPVLSVVGPRTPRPSRPSVVFVFPGHGADPGEADVLKNAAFKHAWEQAQHSLARHNVAHHPGLARTQPNQWAWQVALCAALAQWGITPDAVVGHSLGEVAAAHTAGVLDTADAAHLVSTRARLLEGAAHQGSMLATSLTWEQAQQVAGNYVQVDVAAHNSAEQVVLSGPNYALEAVAEYLVSSGHQARLLPGAPPAHSRLLDQHATSLSHGLRTLSPRPGHVPMYSTATGTHLAGEEMDHRYWGRQLREPVLLHPVIQNLAHQSREVVVVEIGARSVLSAPLALTLARAKSSYALDTPVVSTALDGPADTDLLRAVGELYTRGLDPVWPSTTAPAVPLPLRAWHHPDPNEQPSADEAHMLDIDHTDPERAAEQMRDHVRSTLAWLVPAGIDMHEDDDLAALGVGSLVLAHLHLRLTHTVPGAVDLPPSTLQRCTTPAQIVDAVSQHVRAHIPTH